ncbi:DUF4175 family protein [Flagellimonas sp.]|uniref:DUF4175 family protein n=1 Tax=Flagellimonas sp. TaxID=2058762 RepID=UPI003B502C79
MEAYNNILRKLNEFTKRFYLKQLVKGSLLFLSFGLLFFLMVMFVEYTLWLNQSWRLILFVIFLLVELTLLYRFILVPIFFLLKVRRGLSKKEAAILIGKHFSQIDDKLYNLLELSENHEESELLLASIEQKSQGLKDFSFVGAINFKESLKYAKYVTIPLVIIGTIWLSGNIISFFDSYTRVVNYDLAYEQPAPFTFQVLNDRLEVLDNEPLTIEVETVGSVAPENIFIVVEGERLLLQKRGAGFVYTFQAPVKEKHFYLTANGWDSRGYTIRSIETPSLIDFKMKFTYPAYLGRIADVVSGTGNGVVPEGTKIEWEVKGKNVDEIQMAFKDTTVSFDRVGNDFSKELNVYNSLSYELSTSNSKVKDFERLGYQLEVIKDAYPLVEVEQVMDSINPNQSFFSGEVSDDYGVSSIRAVCYPLDNREMAQRIVLERPNRNVHRFYYTFPSGFKLEEGKDYKVFFEIVDNDGIRGGKITKSKLFNFAFYDSNEVKERKLENQNDVIEKLERSLKGHKEQQESLAKINEKQRGGDKIDFEDKNEIREFLQKQEQQERLMEKFSKELKESLDKQDVSDENRKMLQERLERLELEARKNEKLLEELNKLSEKINQEELKKKLEEVEKRQRSSTRNLEQILELTKRYYVTEKMNQLGKELVKLAERQEVLSKMKLDEQLDSKLQKEENEKFNKLSKELDSLRKENQGLKKPLGMEVSKKDEEAVKQNQQDALEEIDKQQGAEEPSKNEETEKSGNRVSQKQRSAAQKMQEMSQALMQSAGGGGSSDTEDAVMLRQILDNLVTFSFKQETLFDGVENADPDVSQFSKMVKSQNELRGLFEHVDDSLFALSLRRAELSEFVNEQITEVYYNIDKSLESIADNQMFQGASHQQYVINATNALADFLANVLDNMQQSMQPGQGSGQGGDFQLPDIIQGQQGIQEKMNGSGESKNGDSGKPGQDSGGEDGDKGKNGSKENGKEKGKEGGSQNGDNEGGGDGGQDEMGLNEIYEIYKEQQFLRQQLEKQLEDIINNADRNLAKKLIQQMENFENDLLQNGITQRTRTKVNNIQHQLLKLKNASLKQGERNERESNTNDNTFSNPILTRPEALKEQRNEVEILNRQALPLRQNYNSKVKMYFKND